MLIGAHMSIAGGVSKAVDRAAAYDMTALQIFTRSSRTWSSPDLTDEEAGRFRERWRGSSVRAVVAHAGYLANPASPDRSLRVRSEKGLIEELTRCERLGVPWLVLHPGSHVGSGAAGGVRRAGALLGRVLRSTAGFSSGLLVENTAGQGDTLGSSFGEVAAVLAGAGNGDRLGSCIDTCHSFAAGYDLGSKDGFAEAMEELDRTVGFDRVRAVHVNDCLGTLGCRVDRHAGIGLGEMGEDAFRRVVRHPAFCRLPLILETPKAGDDGEDLDRRNLTLLRTFSRGGDEK